MAESANEMNSFAIELYKVLSKNKPQQNVFVSPASLEVVLAMAYTGASGKTATEIASALHLPSDGKNVNELYKNLIASLKSPELKIATKMFIDQTFEVKKKFNEVAKTHYDSEPHTVPFQTNLEAARNTINTWVENQTNKKIKNLIGEGVLAKETVLVLVNAIHFLADWRIQFPEYGTRKDKFFLSESNTIDVDMMANSDTFRYAESSYLDAKILELPYKNKAYSMYIILPNQIQGLSALEDKLTASKLAEELRKLNSFKVNVQMPKFKLTETMQLNEILQSLGINTMFSEAANFSGISDTPLQVSAVVQKAFIDVNEKGTEAAAATAAVVRVKRSMLSELEYEFIANRQFLYFISLERSKSILFIGRFTKLSNPESSANIHEEL